MGSTERRIMELEIKISKLTREIDEAEAAGDIARAMRLRNQRAVLRRELDEKKV